MKRSRILLPLLLIVHAMPALAQRDGGILFSYRLHAGERRQFDDGYRSHLEWHGAKQDSLPWYGWDVLAGRRHGEFIDGTFGIGFAAFDRRVDPAGDAAHAAASFAPHAEATGRWMVRLRRDLSTATPLEDRTPSSLVQVVTYRVAPSDRSSFEAVLKEVRGSSGLIAFAVYECVAGMSDVEYMLLVGRDALATFDTAAVDPARAIENALARVTAVDVRAESELWSLRRDLTLLP